MKALWQRITSWPWGKIVFFVMIAVAATVGAIWLKKIIWPVRPIDTTPTVAQEAPAAVKVERICIPGPKVIYVYPKEELNRKIPQSPETANNPQVQYTATAVIPESPWGGTATAYMNVSTGKGGIGYTAKKRPLFGWGGDGGMGIKGGVGAGNSSTGYTGSVYVRQKIVRVSDVQVSGVGELNISTYQKPEGRAMVDVELFNWR